MDTGARRTAVAAAVIVLALGLPARAAAVGADAALDAVAQRYWSATLAAWPVTASSLGDHRFDDRLDAIAPADWDAQAARDWTALRALDAIDGAALSPRGRADRAAFAGRLRGELASIETSLEWRHKPGGYVDTVAESLNDLIERPYAPAATRLRSAIARTRAIPAYLNQAARNLTGVDAVSARLAADAAEGTAVYLERDVALAFAPAGAPEDRAALRAATGRATTSLRAFARSVRRFVTAPVGTYAIGAAAFRQKLADDEGLDIGVGAYAAAGDRALAQTRARLFAAARAIDPHASVERVIARVAQVHPTGAGLLPAAQADLVKLRRFVIARGLVALPPNASIAVTPTPPYLRDTVTAAMSAPGRLERSARQAFYYVTPVDPRASRAERDGYLGTFNDFERTITSAHEVYPGHYTEFVLRPPGLTRIELLSFTHSFAEGWAHYCEQLVVDEGWGGGDPRMRLMQLREAILRNARWVVGVRMHTAGMTVPQAERFFRERAFMDAVSARAEALRGTQDPTYGYYTFGKLEILKLRDDYRRLRGPAFTLAEFHRALLAHGDLPLPLVRRLLLGDADDGVPLAP